MLTALFISSPALAQPHMADCPPAPIAPTAESLVQLAREAKDRGFLWQVRKNGDSGYLYGSMHLGRLEWAIPGPQVMAALQSSAVIAVELDVLDPKIQLQMSDYARSGIRRPTLPPSLKQRLASAVRRVCVPEKAMTDLHPMMQMITVSMLDARYAGLDISYGTEMFLLGYARTANRKIESLESADLQIRALLGGDDNDVIESIDSSLKLFEAGKQRALTERIVNAWVNGNLEEFNRYEQWCECMKTEADRKSMRRLLDDRNPHLAAGIDRLMRGGRTVFAAVGALHMTGAKALPRLLEAMGYSVERVVFTR